MSVPRGPLSHYPSIVRVEHPGWKEIGYVKSNETINLQSAYQHAKGCKPLTGECVNSNAGIRRHKCVCLRYSIQPPNPGVSSRPSVASWIHLTTSADLCFLCPPLLHYSFSCSQAFSVLCLINKTYLCACSLTSSSSCLVPKAKLWAHAELMKQRRWMAFSNWEKITTIQAFSRLRELCL